MPRGLRPEELKELCERFGPSIHRRALALLGRDADAWDAMQEVFERLIRAGSAFRGDARPMTYVYRITTNVCLNMLRNRALREPPGAVDVSEAWAGAPSPETTNLVRALLDRLGERQQQVAVFHYVDEMGQEEIAQLLGLSRKTIQRDLDVIRQSAQLLQISTESGDG